MHTPFLSYISLLAILLTSSCRDRHKYETGHFTETVTNFAEINSEYDDYNSTEPFINHNHLLWFSSNRNSKGNHFDIVGEEIRIFWSMNNGTLEIDTNWRNHYSDYLKPMADSVNTPCNELGPYAFGYRTEISNAEVLWTDLLMFSNDCSGHFDIQFIYRANQTNNQTIQHTVQPIRFLNSAANDLYPSFYGEGFYHFDEWGTDVSKIKKIVFCSDREGDFNLYEVSLPGHSSLIETLSSDSLLETTKLSINTLQDDKCPFVNGKLLVFTSNRSGGYGGFDLYYSLWSNNTWTAPINFGEKINTGYDEYRPITLYYNKFDNSLMIFSSNRPGGKGGYDLYYVGIKQMIK